MAKKSVVEIIVDTIQAAGVQRVYGVIGAGLAGLAEAIHAREGLTWVEVQHEEAGALAAGGEAAITSSLAVCVGACGPGNTQLLNGLYDCHCNHLPVLAIVAQVPSYEIGSSYYQETRPESLFRDCSYYCATIAVPEQAVRVTEAAAQAALSRGGVGVVVLPADVATLLAEAPAPHIASLGHHSAIVPASDKISLAAQVLNNCEKITILAGSGMEGAHHELLQVAQTLQAPVVYCMRGKECAEAHNPFAVGLVGPSGLPASCHALQAADGVLMLGTDFPHRDYFSEQGRVVQVDKHPERLGRRARVAVSLHGTVPETLQLLLPQLQIRTSGAFLQAAQRQHTADEQHLAELATAPPSEAALRPQHLTYVLDELATADAIFTCDTGAPLTWAGRYLHMNGRRRLLNSVVHGSLGAALPQAIGAALAAPGRQVVALCSSQGFAMLLGELLTLRQAQVPVKVVVLNNSNFRAEVPSAAGAGLPAPDFARLAEAAGIRGLRVSDPTQLAAVLRETLADDGPVVVDALVRHEQLLFAANEALDWDQPAELTLLSGHGGELPAQAKAKLFS